MEASSWLSKSNSGSRAGSRSHYVWQKPGLWDGNGGGIHGAMTTKEQVLEAVHDLPADATFEDAMERLFFLAKIARGLQQADAGQTVPHAQVKQQMAKWLK